MSRKIAGYGWRRDLPDFRDFLYAAPAEMLAALPPKIDLRAQCPPVYDQGQLGCHDEATEVLTEDGWVRWPEYDGRALLGAVDPVSGLLGYEAPTALHAYEYDGPMVYGQHRAVDLCVTPNHRMYVRKWDERARSLAPDFGFVEASDLGWYAGLMHAPAGAVGLDLEAVTLEGRTYLGDDFVALVAMLAADGYVAGTDNNRDLVSFCCFKPTWRERVVGLAKRAGFEEQQSRPGVWRTRDPRLAAWLRDNLYTGGKLGALAKRVPPVIKTLGARQTSLFLDNFGDQHVGLAGRQFYSSSKRLIDDLQELLLRIGRRGSIVPDPPKNVTMRDGREISADRCAMAYALVERRTERLSLERKKHVGDARYKGTVFCATVPSGLLVTRRDDRVLVSGNSCTANAIGAAVEFDLKKQSLADATPSRLFIYYNERVIENSVDQDAGAEIRDGIKSVAKQGVCPEAEWPYDIARFAERPSDACYADALQIRAVNYARVQQTRSQMKGCLAAGSPFVFGFSVYQSFESDEVAKTGVVPMPHRLERPVGGHAVLAVGYDDGERRFIARNSWGGDWGQSGYFTMPYEYLTDPNLASDFWTIRLVS